MPLPAVAAGGRSRRAARTPDTRPARYLHDPGPRRRRKWSEGRLFESGKGIRGGGGAVVGGGCAAPRPGVMSRHLPRPWPFAPPRTPPAGLPRSNPCALRGARRFVQIRACPESTHEFAHGAGQCNTTVSIDWRGTLTDGSVPEVIDATANEPATNRTANPAIAPAIWPTIAIMTAEIGHERTYDMSLISSLKKSKFEVLDALCPAMSIILCVWTLC